MLILIKGLSILLPVFYVIVLIDYILLFFREDPFAKKTVTALLKVSVSLHIILTVFRTFIYEHIPISSIFEVFSVLALAIVIVYLYIEETTGVKTTGLFIVAFVFLFQLISSIFQVDNLEINPLLVSKFFGLHVTSAILGYSAITISAIYGFLYLMLYHELKSNRFGLIYNRLPSLEVLGNMNYNSAVIAFIFMTFAIILGAIWSSIMLDTHWYWDPKLISVLVNWLIFGVISIKKKFFGFRGKKVAYLSLLGFFVMLFSMIIVNLYFTRFHEFI